MQKLIFKISFLFLLFLAVPVQALNLNEAARELYQKLESEPSNLNVKMDLAYLFSEGLEYERAVELYEEVIEVAPENLRALNELCYLHTFMRVKDKAFLRCEELARRQPDKMLVYDNLGLSYFKFGEHRLALKAFLKAYELQPSALLVKNHLGMTFLAMQENVLARESYVKWLDAAGQGSKEEKALLYYGLYQAERNLKNYDKAYQAIAKTYELSENPLYLGKMIVVFMKAHEFWFFLLVSAVFLWGCRYLGQRLNRFLKNET